MSKCYFAASATTTTNRTVTPKMRIEWWLVLAFVDAQL
jgi:hypothetical protein